MEDRVRGGRWTKRNVCDSDLVPVHVERGISQGTPRLIVSESNRGHPDEQALNPTPVVMAPVVLAFDWSL